MFGMSGTEMLIVLAVALLLFGPDKLPEMAKMLGKAMREFQKATGDIRSTVETEFKKLADIEPEAAKPAEPKPANVVKLEPAVGAVPSEPRIAPPGLAKEPAPAPEASPDVAEKPQP